MSQTPLLVVIIGSTGSGKTKLSIELAEALVRSNIKSEVVSADAMQVYRNIDVLSAKATPIEQARVKHHLIDVVDLENTSFNVTVYQSAALQLLSDLQERSCVPILVGGTNYYIKSVVWASEYKFDVCDGELESHLRQELEGLTNEQLFSRLVSVDPVRAELLHHNARRKVMRSLEIFYITGKCHSQLIEEQQRAAAELRFRTCFLWVHCDKEVLDTRISKRVDDMIDSGLKNEVRFVAETFKDKELCWQRGALQSIGLREFRDWVEHFHQTGSDDADLWTGAIESVKIHSRQYAKSQISWIKNSLVPIATVFKLDSTNPSQWYQNVLAPAVKIVSDLIQGHTLEEVAEPFCSPKEDSNVQVLSPLGSTVTKKAAWKKFTCDLCKKTVNGEEEWIAHGKSKQHRAARKRHFKVAISPANASSSTGPSAFDLK